MVGGGFYKNRVRPWWLSRLPKTPLWIRQLDCKQTRSLRYSIKYFVFAYHISTRNLFEMPTLSPQWKKVSNILVLILFSFLFTYFGDTRPSLDHISAVVVLHISFELFVTLSWQAPFFTRENIILHLLDFNPIIIACSVAY